MMINAIWRWTRNFTVMKHHRYSSIVFIICCLYALSSAWFSVNTYDEGIIVTGGMRVLHGDIPHRDFASLYPYGSYYISAGLQYLFGSWYIPFRLCGSLVFAGLCTLTYLFSTRIGMPSFYAILTSITTCLWCGLPHVSLRAAFLALLCAFSALYIISGTHKHKFLFSLLLLSVASVIRWDIALYGGIAWSAYCFISASLDWRMVCVYLFIIGIMTIIFPLVTLWIVGGELAVKYAIEQTILFPVFEFPSVRGLSFPLFLPRWNGESMADIILASFALWGMIGVLLIAGFFYRHMRLISSNIPTTAMLLIFMICLMNQARVRSDFEHCIPALFPFFILIFIFKSYKKFPKKNAFILTLCLVSMPVALKGKQWFHSLSYSPYTTMWGKGMYGNNAPSYDSLVYLIQKETAPHDRIFICPQQGQSNQSNDIFLYYAAQRIPVSYFHEFHPGITDKVMTQNHIINDCLYHKCQVIIRQHLPSVQPVQKVNNAPASVLDTFITRHYEKVRSINGYDIMILLPQQ